MSAARKSSSSSIGIIDIFAGPGGLGEGFSSFECRPGVRPFSLEVSAEMESSAHATLTLRAFYRLLSQSEGRLPKKYLEFLRQFSLADKLSPSAHFGEGPLSSLWKQAESEALRLTLGLPEHNAILHQRVASAKRKGGALVVIGGPPCQAYSIVGRARNAKDEAFKLHGDKKHFLYREYLEILASYSPDAFIMENVKGILSSTVGGRDMFRQIHQDLSDPAAALGASVTRSSVRPEYLLLPVALNNGDSRDSSAAAKDPMDFVIRCENHGVPQARHRVIIMGIRVDHAAKALTAPGLTMPKEQITVADALVGLPRLRSGLSDQFDSGEAWREVVGRQCKLVKRVIGKSDLKLREKLESLRLPSLHRSSTQYTGKEPVQLKGIHAKKQDVLLNHETRSHMESDLARYLFSSAFAAVHGISPTSAEFPLELAPDHGNWFSGSFADRFRTQLRGRPSSTVTSHLSKDGHAFIHYDPSQCRSLTVREAARLQTFPDDYLFLGNRTQQFVQVGNAVPPMIARQIAAVIWSILGK
ncbi:DNA cytosine methyltransferase [Dyella amyloliquefaciens]|uniref:DNA cytosine methyltransferase n=1 Tax=Dyella amyloliquefaciens TaxID=1770545 RepID=UPI00102E7EBD|nr:DNA (cytosine-5-)-methyltransferase [Dyella amyloliquefaciens]